MTPFHDAVVASDEGTLRQLILEKSELINARDEDQRTALHWAAARGQLRLVELLCSADDVHVNTQDDGGWTPIMSAVSAGHVDVVQYLLARGADANIANGNGQVPLHYHRGRADVVEVLLDVTKDIDQADGIGTTPLMRAVGARPSPHVVALLLDHGANVNKRDHSGNTALHLALMEQNEALATFLVQAGADVKAKNHENVRCIDIAASSLLSEWKASGCKKIP